MADLTDPGGSGAAGGARGGGGAAGEEGNGEAVPGRFEGALAALTQSAGQLGIEDQRHAFWETQPVGQFRDAGASLPEGPIEPPQPETVRAEPYALPKAYEWSTCDLSDPGVVREVYALLTANYVEDDDNMFRFDYSQEFLRWALHPPGFKPDWHVGVRAAGGARKLVAFITGVPAKIRARNAEVEMAEINFLCVHKKLRSKRLAPVLIQEVTRRVHKAGIWQATYTAGVVLPTPIATCQYWHRSLNPKKLIDVGFSRLLPRMTMSRTVKLYRLPERPATTGLRAMVLKDVPAVTRLLSSYLARFVVAPIFTEEEVAHLLMPQAGVVHTMVVAPPPENEVTDFFSFYALPSSIIGNAEHSTLRAAYCFYTVAVQVPLNQLLNDALIVAKGMDFDVFNALDIMHNGTFLRELKFGPGDGQLHYYLYNYRIASKLSSDQLGLVLL